MNTPLALIVEDEPDLANIFSRALETGGFNTQTAPNGEKALAYLGESIPDIIILDLHLPDMDGLTILQKIREDHRLDNSKVIVASADAQMVQLAEDKADLILVKPVSVSQLRDLAMRIRVLNK